MAAGITINGSSISKALVGSSAVGAIWLNGVKVYDSTPPAPAGHTVTIYVSGSTFEMTMSNNTLTIDGTDYFINGTVSDISTDFEDNGVQITAENVSVSGENFRWKDSDTSSWQENVAKTWTIPRDNFEIWIEVAIDE